MQNCSWKKLGVSMVSCLDLAKILFTMLSGRHKRCCVKGDATFIFLSFPAWFFLFSIFFFLTLKMTSSCILRHIYMAFCINWQWNISGLQRQLISEYSCLQMKTTLLGVSQGQQKWIWQEPRCNGLKYWLIYALVAHT